MKSIYLITGFLGSGKTSFLNHVLSNTAEKVAVLMNEFGKVSIDSIVLNKKEIDLVELKNGSIFCSCLKENFIKALVDLVSTDVELIFIESTGLADPSDIEKVMGLVGKLSLNTAFEFKGTICLIDAPLFFRELETLVSVEKQLRHSHLMIVNKTDLVDDKTISAIDDKIKVLQPGGKIIHTTHGRVTLEQLENRYFHIPDEQSSNTVSTRPSSVILHLDEVPTKRNLLKLLEKLTDSFYRIKGIVKLKEGWFKVDLVMNQIVIEPYTGCTTGAHDYNQLVCLASQGIRSISKLSTEVASTLETAFRLEV